MGPSRVNTDLREGMGAGGGPSELDDSLYDRRPRNATFMDVVELQLLD